MKMQKIGRQLGLGMLTLAILAGCGGSQPDGAQVRTGELVVKMQGLKYTPARFTVKAGTRIIFTNQDAIEHDVVQIALDQLGKAEPGWVSPIIDSTGSWSITLDQPGVYPFVCTQYAHYTAGMVGTITVVP